jgi:hypothetical protein
MELGSRSTFPLSWISSVVRTSSLCASPYGFHFCFTNTPHEYLDGTVPGWRQLKQLAKSDCKAPNNDKCLSCSQTRKWTEIENHFKNCWEIIEKCLRLFALLEGATRRNSQKAAISVESQRRDWIRTLGILYIKNTKKSGFVCYR